MIKIELYVKILFKICFNVRITSYKPAVLNMIWQGVL